MERAVFAEPPAGGPGPSAPTSGRGALPAGLTTLERDRRAGRAWIDRRGVRGQPA